MIGSCIERQVHIYIQNKNYLPSPFMQCCVLCCVVLCCVVLCCVVLCCVVLCCVVLCCVDWNHFGYHCRCIQVQY